MKVVPLSFAQFFATSIKKLWKLSDIPIRVTR